MKATIPDPTSLARALAGRVDALDERTGALEGDVAALGRGLAHLTTTLRTLTAPGQPPTTHNEHGDSDSDGDGDGDGDGEVPGGQRDWAAPGLDTETATAWLTEISDWLAGPGTVLGLDRDVPACWALHPGVVTDLLALTAAHTAAWTGPDPLAVCEWLARWAPGCRDRIATATTDCRTTGAHTAGDHTTWALPPDGLSPGTVAAWWTTHRDQPPETHLPLRRI